MLIPGLDLTELKSRVAVALRSNSSVANVDGYVEVIQEAVAKFQTVEPGSGTKYLYQLICLAEAIDESTAEVISVTAPAPEPVVEEPKEPESPLVVEEPKEPEPAQESEVIAEESASDDEWTETTAEEPHEEKPEAHESKPAKPAKSKKHKKP